MFSPAEMCNSLKLNYIAPSLPNIFAIGRTMSTTNSVLHQMAIVFVWMSSWITLTWHICINKHNIIDQNDIESNYVRIFIIGHPALRDVVEPSTKGCCRTQHCRILWNPALWDFVEPRNVGCCGTQHCGML